jgi:hypothetical protein
MGKSYFRSTNFLNRRQHMKPNADSDGGVWNPRTVITPSCSVHPYSLWPYLDIVQKVLQILDDFVCFDYM